MILDDKQTTPELYAKLYAEFKFVGTPWLAYRDMPAILNQFVKNKKALDYGCGTGESTFFLKSLNYDVTGVDINDTMLSIAAGKDPSGKYIKIDKNGIIPFEDNIFDLVFCSFVLLEIDNKEKILSIAGEIKRILKKGGIFISISASNDTYNHEWLTLNTNFPENKNIVSGSKIKIEFKEIGLTIDDYFWTEEDYAEIFSAAGLNILKVYKPLGRADDGYIWKDEQKIAPSSIFICEKK